MFEHHLSTNPSFRIASRLDTLLPPGDYFSPLMWGEHCMECAAPHCYTSCPRFKQRIDGHCERFYGGLRPVADKGSIGTHIHFKSWGKLETVLEAKAWKRADYIAYYRWVYIAGLLFRIPAQLLPTYRTKNRCFLLWHRFVWRALRRRIPEIPATSATFRCTLINLTQPTQLLLDTRTHQYQLDARKLIDLPAGAEQIVSADIDLTRLAFLSLHPLNAEEEPDIIIRDACLIPKEPQAAKVKCVIWDLDQTLWTGILVEHQDVELRDSFVQLIRDLDARGIVNSIASKNNEDQARELLHRWGIEELFVFCKINWEPKSINIRSTISDMNINPNTVVFVDDSPFEREEVSSAIEGITCLDPSEIENYSKTERFQVPLSAESAGRRQSYRRLEQMVRDRQHWTGNIDSFLLSCDIRLEISLLQASETDRCHELLQRTNQLNASGRRLSKEDILRFMQSDHHDCIVMKSSDKYGDYGLVGFMIVERSEQQALITDFVISCRVARKKIETTLINHLARNYGGIVCFAFKATKVNQPMRAAIDELKMTYSRQEEGTEIYSHAYNEHYPLLVRISDRVFAGM